MNTGPKLFDALLLTLLAALCFALAYYEERWSEGLRIFLTVCGVAFLMFACLSAWNWIRYENNQRYKERQRVSEETADVKIWQERTELMRLIIRLTPEQIEAISRNGAVSRALFGNSGTLVGFESEYGYIFFDLVDDFIAHSSDTHLCPISHWSEGSRYRKQAEELTKLLIWQSFAEYSGEPGRTGPKPPAVWAYAGAREDAIEAIYGARVKRWDEVKVKLEAI